LHLVPFGLNGRAYVSCPFGSDMASYRNQMMHIKERSEILLDKHPVGVSSRQYLTRLVVERERFDVLPGLARHVV
jgi:hypothetical protein